MPQLPPAELPPPPTAALVQSEALVAKIVASIRRNGGAIGFDTFMEAALYEPGYAAGDFVTAPELSPLFGRCIARELAGWLKEHPYWELVEVGAGSGSLAAAVLTRLSEAGETQPSALKSYSILERSADLRERQRHTLVSAIGEQAVERQVRWLDDLPPTGFKGVILGNELLDALPAKLFEVMGGGFVELCVTERGGALDFTTRAPDSEFAAQLEALQRDLLWELSPGYRSELGLAAQAWIRTVAERMQEGVVLLFDYGYPRGEYYHEQRRQGTLRCYYRHRVHENPFIYPGLQDISVHVDFSALARAAVDSGLHLAGFTSQAAFLLATGLLEFAQELEPGTPQQVALSHRLRQLMMPGEMGEAVKAVAFTRSVRPVMLGFSELDYSPRLGL